MLSSRWWMILTTPTITVPSQNTMRNKHAVSAMDDVERVVRDLRNEHRDPADYDIDGIVADLRASARRPGDIDTAPDDAWSTALIQRGNDPTAFLYDEDGLPT